MSAPGDAPPRVLVAGAGPTGLVLGSELLRRGVPCRIVDKAAGPADKSRAIAVHSRTLETLDALGLADDLIARGMPPRPPRAVRRLDGYVGYRNQPAEGERLFAHLERLFAGSTEPASRPGELR